MQPADPTSAMIPTGMMTSGMAPRTSSYESGLQQLATQSAPPRAAEFGAALPNSSSKEESLNNPLAQLLQIRSEINISCGPMPGPFGRSFPALAYPGMGTAAFAPLPGMPGKGAGSC